MSALDPYSVLQRAWEQYKRELKVARGELHRANDHKSGVIRGYRTATAANWHLEARTHWIDAVHRAAGVDARIEWVGDVNKPMCLINGVMMFA